MFLASPSKILVKTIEEKEQKPKYNEGRLPELESIDTILDLEMVVAELDKCMRFADINRFITEDVTDVRHLIPWLQEQDLLGQAGRLFKPLASGEGSSTLPQHSMENCARLYLILFAVHVILHDRRLQHSVLESLRVVKVCFDIIIGNHVNLYRIRPLEGARIFSLGMSDVLEQLMGLDAFVNEFDRLKLFESYREGSERTLLDQYVPPGVPPGYSIELYIRENLLLPSSETNEPALKRVAEQIPSQCEPIQFVVVRPARTGGQQRPATSEIGRSLFSFHLLKTNALSSFDVSTYSFLSHIRLQLYKDLLTRMTKEQVVEEKIANLLNLFDQLPHIGKSMNKEEIEDNMKQLSASLSTFITYLHIYRFIGEHTQINQFSLIEIQCAALISSEKATQTAKKSAASFAVISQYLRAIAAAIVSRMPLVHRFLSWLMRAHNTSSICIFQAALAQYQTVLEKMMIITEETLMYRASLGFSLFSIKEDKICEILKKRGDSPSNIALNGSQFFDLKVIEEGLIRDLFYEETSGETVEASYLHEKIISSIGPAVTHFKKATPNGQKVTEFYGLIPYLLHSLLYLVTLTISMFLEDDFSSAAYTLQLTESIFFSITNIFNALCQNNRQFCRIQLASISTFLKGFSQSIEVVLSELHTSARAIYKRVRALQSDSRDRDEKYLKIYLRLAEITLKSLQSVLNAGVVLLDQKLFVIGVRYITSFVSSEAFCIACWLLKQLLPYKDMREFARCYTLDGMPIHVYLIEKTQATLKDPVCLNCLATLLSCF